MKLSVGPWTLKETPKRISIVDGEDNVICIFTQSKGISREQMVGNARLMKYSLELFGNVSAFLDTQNEAYDCDQSLEDIEKTMRKIEDKF